MSKLADYAVLQLFYCLGIVSIDVFIEEAPREEMRGSDVTERTHSSMHFQLIWLVMVGNRKDSLGMPQSFRYNTSNKIRSVAVRNVFNRVGVLLPTASGLLESLEGELPLTPYHPEKCGQVCSGPSDISPCTSTFRTTLRNVSVPILPRLSKGLLVKGDLCQLAPFTNVHQDHCRSEEHPSDQQHCHKFSTGGDGF